MPHITLQCSNNLEFDYLSFFKELCAKLVDTGHAPALGMKCRVDRCKEYFIIDGSDDYKMANLILSLREGRSDDVLIEFSNIGMKLMEKYMKHDCEETNVILSTQINELKKGRDLTKNYIRKKFESQNK